MPGVDSPEDDFIDSFLVNNLPTDNLPLLEYFPEHWRLTGILLHMVQIILNEIKKGLDVGISSVFG
jgi:hypothetical protein